MSTEQLSVTTTISATPDAVFTVLTDPTRHAAIDGTGWVRAALDTERLTAPRQVFRMAMHHGDHPDGRYEIANQVREFAHAEVIAWAPGTGHRAPGTEDENGRLSFGGWTWRYDLIPNADGDTDVRLSYDWSGANSRAREVITFPPFDAEHLKNSLLNLAVLVRA